MMCVRRRAIRTVKPSPASPPTPSCIFTRLAVEVLEHILSFIDHPRDLLALALTSKRAHRIIVPVHIQTRYIRCDARRIALWKRLIEIPQLASRFVSLKITREQTYLSQASADVIVPAYLFDPDDPALYSDTNAVETTLTRQLSAVLRLMPSLTCFHWTHYWADIIPDVIVALRDTCPDISDLRLKIRKFVDFEESHRSLWDFPKLSRFSFITDYNPIDIDHYYSVLDMLMSRCNRLEHLEMNNGHLVANRVFGWALWPHLKTLYLTSNSLVRTAANVEMVDRFLFMHTNLARVNITEVAPPYRAAHGPRLREITLGFGHSQRGLLPATSCRLEYLCVHDVDPIAPPAYFSALPALRSLVVRTVPLAAAAKYIAQTLPHIERLHMTWPFGHLQRANIESDQHPAFESACGFLSNMTCLTHLSHFVKMLNLSSNLVDVVLRRFAGACPTLTFVELHPWGKWVTIERDQQDGSYVGWHVTEKLRGLHGRLGRSLLRKGMKRLLLIHDWDPTSHSSPRLEPLARFLDQKRLGPFSSACTGAFIVPEVVHDTKSA